MATASPGSIDSAFSGHLDALDESLPRFGRRLSLLPLSDVRQTEVCPGCSIVGIDFESLLEQLFCFGCGPGGGSEQKMASPQHQIEGLGIDVLRDNLLATEQSHLERRGDRACNVVLDREDVLEGTVVGLRPEVDAVCDVDQLGADPYLVAGFTDAPPRGWSRR